MIRILCAIIIAGLAAACVTDSYGGTDPVHDGSHCIRRQVPACPDQPA